MKKLFLVLISILLLTGVAQAVDFDQSVTAEFSAQNTSRSIVTDGSVLLQVYYKGTGLNPSMGASADSVILYDDGLADLTVDTTATATDTVGEIVDTINADGDWVAVAGPDGYKGYTVNGAIIAADAVGVTTGAGINTYIGRNLDTAGGVYGDSSTSTHMLCGVRADPTARIRLKSINHTLCGALVTNGDAIIDVYDDNTRIYRKILSAAVNNSTTAIASSANTVIPVSNDSKGLAATKGNSLCVVVDTNSVDASAGAKTIDQVTITYDKLRI